MQNKQTLFIGIDPSINSTGVVMRLCDPELRELSIKYYILKGDSHEVTKKGGMPVSPLSKKELAAQAKYDCFNYVVYNKDPIQSGVTSVENELAKTHSFIALSKKLIRIIDDACEEFGNPEVYVVLEGISYGSTLKTTAIFDLAGLNYMLRWAVSQFTDNMIVAPPSHVKKFATGVGSAKKDLMVSAFKAIHPELELPKIDDVADAFFMSRLAQRYYEQQQF